MKKPTLFLWLGALLIISHSLSAQQNPQEDNSKIIELEKQMKSFKTELEQVKTESASNLTISKILLQVIPAIIGGVLSGIVGIWIARRSFSLSEESKEKERYLAENDRNKKQEKEIENLSLMLFEELKLNYLSIHRVHDTSNGAAVNIKRFLQSNLSSNYYDSYLNRIPTLEQDSVKKIILAYLSVQQIVTYCKLPDALHILPKMKTNSLEKIKSALECWPKGNNFIEELAKSKSNRNHYYEEMGINTMPVS